MKKQLTTKEEPGLEKASRQQQLLKEAIQILSKSMLSAEEVIDQICTRAGNKLYEKYLSEKLKLYRGKRAIFDINETQF